MAACSNSSDCKSELEWTVAKKRRRPYRIVVADDDPCYLYFLDHISDGQLYIGPDDLRQLFTLYELSHMIAVLTKIIVNHQIDYPYKRYYLRDPVDMYRELKSEDYVHIVNPTGNFSKYDVVETSYDMVSQPGSYGSNVISDYFSEDARIRACVKRNPSPYEKFFHRDGARFVASRVLDTALNEGRKYGINTYGLREAAWDHSGQTFAECTQFKATFSRTLCEQLSAVRVLNPCGGWGCRAFGCVSADSVEIMVDVDPNPHLIEPYRQIKEFLSEHEPDTTLIQHQMAFEEYSEEQLAIDFNGNKPDLIFTSPPFGFHEIYNKSDDKQSTYDIESHTKWVTEWFIPFLDQCWSYLDDDGYLALYVADAGGDIIKPMLKHMTNNDRPLWSTYGCRNTRQSYATIGIYVWKK